MYTLVNKKEQKNNARRQNETLTDQLKPYKKVASVFEVE